MSSKLASLLIKISANGAEAQKELQTLMDKATKFGDKLKDLGSTMTKYVTVPLTALAAVSVKAANDQQKAEAKLLTALKGRKDIQDRLLKQAKDAQNRTLFADEDIVNQQAYLAALGLSEQQINDTMEAAIQLSAALGMELDASVKNLAKTYGGLTGELGESIPALKELTAEQLKAGEAIKYVNENYKGFAETAAESGAGKLQQLKNKFMDLAVKIGEVLLPVLNSLAEMPIPILEWFTSMPGWVQGVVVGIGGLVAAIGPLLTVVGSLINAFKMLKVAAAASGQSMVAAFGKGGGAFAAITALLVLVTGFIDMLDRTDKLLEKYREERRDEISQSERAYKDYILRQYYGGTVPAHYVNGTYIPERHIEGDHNLDAAKAELERLKRNRKVGDIALNDARIRGAEAAIREIELDLQRLSENKDLQEAYGLIPQLQTKIKSLQEQLKMAGTVEEIARINAEIAKTNEELTRLQGVMPDDLNKQRVSMLPIIGAKPSFGVGPVKGGELKTDYSLLFWAEQMRAEAEEAAARIEEVRGILNDAISNLAVDMANGLGDAIESLITGEEFYPLQRFLELLGNTLKQLGSALVTYAVTLEAFKKAFSNPWAALAAGIAAIAAGAAFVALAKKPIKLATGGLAYGPTLAVVGDNPGATNDPEVVAPLSKLRDYVGGTQRLELVGDVSFELHGDVLRVVLDRDNFRLSTLG